MAAGTKHDRIKRDRQGQINMADRDQIAREAPLRWEQIRSRIRSRVEEFNRQLGHEALVWTSVTATEAIIKVTNGKAHAIASFDPIKFNIGGTWIADGEPLTARIIDGSVCFCGHENTAKTPEDIANAMLASLQPHIE